MKNLRQDALTIFNAGVAAVRGRQLVDSHVTIEDGSLIVADHAFSAADYDRVVVVGAGKATAAMAAGLVATLGGWLPVHGWINVPAGTEIAMDGVHVHTARPAGVNEPRSEGVYGTEQILRIAEQAGPRDLCIALISGGGSALLPAPRKGMTLEDKITVIRFLSGSGADITELNTVRKHLSEVKGGGLLRACRAGHLLTLVLSDVLGDPVDLIASGPTVEDRSKQHEALEIVQRFDPDKTLPSSVYSLLQSQPPARPAVTTQTTVIVLGNNALAVDEAGICAERLGFNHVMHSASRAEGSAEEVGRHHAEMIVNMLRDHTGHRSNCLITGGEPVVTLAPENIRGLGGRNQQLVLAAYQHLRDGDLTDAEWSRFAFLSAGTDGEDGPTDAAGAILDGAVHQAAIARSLDLADQLRRNDAYRFFEKCGGLIRTGPTGTNVCDLRVAVVASG
ncbi:glycerate kinase type-2 family protein [Novipirellula artificiosorum]|uniref:Putative hydroxypyruvate reductase n=1 Tax=Novipirellula artificiosorum TaxID=2528016 RepID=A0A5C6DZ56_9BACT|nr:DUF4147 domain-containing protein [Novipirellula artificiosorum]TWU42723.1 putative hydroxypyruvate reductase [Novipirellula artificiosorum]